MSATLPDGTVISYDHDPLGRRIAKRINGTVVEKYLLSGRIKLMAVYDGNDNLISRFTYTDERMPVSMEKNGVKYYLMYDQVGSLRGVADDIGNIIKRVDYDSFGNIISDDNPGFRVPFGFAGGLYDRDTGLVRFGARDYDPTISRWTAKDPIDFAGGDLNLFSYVGNSPMNWIDPFGLINWGKVGSGIFTQLVGWGTFYGGVAITAIGIVEVMHGFPLGLHAITPGGTMMGMGGYLIYKGGTFIYEGFAELDKPKDTGCPKK